MKEIEMDNKKMDDELMKVVREWEYLSVEQKKKIVWIVRLDKFRLRVMQSIPILFLITLVQFVIWLIIR